MGMKTPFEGRPLMLKQIEEHERLQQLAEIGRAHPAGDRAVLPASRALRNPAYSRLCSRGLFTRNGHFFFGCYDYCLNYAAARGVRRGPARRLSLLKLSVVRVAGFVK